MRLYALIGGGVFLLLLAIAVKVHLSNDKAREAKLEGLENWQGEIIVAVSEAADNKVNAKTAIGQVRALGDSYRAIRVELDETNQTIDDMAREAVRLRKRAEELKRIADKAEAQRRAALERLSDMSLTPGTREDCMVLLREAEEALNLVREAQV